MNYYKSLYAIVMGTLLIYSPTYGMENLSSSQIVPKGNAPISVFQKVQSENEDLFSSKIHGTGSEIRDEKYENFINAYYNLPFELNTLRTTNPQQNITALKKNILKDITTFKDFIQERDISIIKGEKSRRIEDLNRMSATISHSNSFPEKLINDFKRIINNAYTITTKNLQDILAGKDITKSYIQHEELEEARLKREAAEAKLIEEAKQIAINNWLETPAERALYVTNKSSWPLKTKTYILQLLWLDAANNKNLSAMAVFRKALEGLNQQTPSSIHNKGDAKKTPLLISYFEEIPEDADTSLKKFIIDQEAKITPKMIQTFSAYKKQSLEDNLKNWEHYQKSLEQYENTITDEKEKNKIKKFIKNANHTIELKKNRLILKALVKEKLNLVKQDPESLENLIAYQNALKNYMAAVANRLDKQELEKEIAEIQSKIEKPEKALHQDPKKALELQAKEVVQEMEREATERTLAAEKAVEAEQARQALEMKIEEASDLLKEINKKTFQYRDAFKNNLKPQQSPEDLSNAIADLEHYLSDNTKKLLSEYPDQKIVTELYNNVATTLALYTHELNAQKVFILENYINEKADALLKRIGSMNPQYEAETERLKTEIRTAQLELEKILDDALVKLTQELESASEDEKEKINKNIQHIKLKMEIVKTLNSLDDLTLMINSATENELQEKSKEVVTNFIRMDNALEPDIVDNFDQNRINFIINQRPSIIKPLLENKLTFHDKTISLLSEIGYENFRNMYHSIKDLLNKLQTQIPTPIIKQSSPSQLSINYGFSVGDYLKNNPQPNTPAATQPEPITIIPVAIPPVPAPTNNRPIGRVLQGQRPIPQTIRITPVVQIPPATVQLEPTPRKSNNLMGKFLSIFKGIGNYLSSRWRAIFG